MTDFREFGWAVPAAGASGSWPARLSLTSGMEVRDAGCGVAGLPGRASGSRTPGSDPETPGSRLLIIRAMQLRAASADRSHPTDPALLLDAAFVQGPFNGTWNDVHVWKTGRGEA